MTFSKPSSTNNVVGSYTFKSGVSSSAENYIDNNFPDALDKTGDTITGNISITGTLEFSGLGAFDSNIVFLSTLATPTLIQQAPLLDAQAGQLTIQSADAFAGASVHPNGGTLVIGTGNPAFGAAPGNLNINLGHGFGTTISVLEAGHTVTSLYGAEVLGFYLDGYNMNQNLPILFQATVAAPSITQTTTAAGNGASLTIGAQSTTGILGEHGGSVVLNAGTGPFANGGVQLNTAAGATTMMNVIGSSMTLFPSSGSYALQVQNVQGTNLGQVGQNTIIPFVTQTIGTSTQFLTLGIEDNSVMFIEVVWIQRNISDDTLAFGNRMGCVVTCGGSGTVSAAASAPLYGGGDFDSTAISIASAGTRSVGLTAVYLSGSDAQIWQGQVYVTYM